MFGIVSGVGVDSRNRVYVFHRAGRTWPDSDKLDTKPISRYTVQIFDGSTGKLAGQWGKDCFAMPHGLTVDAEDNVWLTDVALQQVYKYSRDGRMLMTLGERGVAGDDYSHFNRPTDVAVATDGSFYVSDGYINSRVLRFGRDGKFVLKWGTKGSGPGQFDLPHGIALDKNGRVYVADRSNRRVQVFSGDGRFIAEWKDPSMGRPYDVAIGSDGLAYVADGGDSPKEPPDRSGVAVLRLDGTLVEQFGRFGFYDGQFYRAHDLAVGKDGAVYVGDAGERVQKFVRSR